MNKEETRRMGQELSSSGRISSFGSGLSLQWSDIIFRFRAPSNEGGSRRSLDVRDNRGTDDDDA